MQPTGVLLLLLSAGGGAAAFTNTCKSLRGRLTGAVLRIGRGVAVRRGSNTTEQLSWHTSFRTGLSSNTSPLSTCVSTPRA